ncbi:hypothetical protein KSS87_001008 [Heliosperma pusillum]|nr:hypothetical protein KSS87_001008 [Heliosperma pusillum]
MSRRPVNPTRRLVGNGGFPLMGSFPSKTRSSPLVSLTLVVLGVFLILGYMYSGSGMSEDSVLICLILKFLMTSVTWRCFLRYGEVQVMPSILYCFSLHILQSTCNCPLHRQRGSYPF